MTGRPRSLASGRSRLAVDIDSEVTALRAALRKRWPELLGVKIDDLVPWVKTRAPISPVPAAPYGGSTPGGPFRHAWIRPGDVMSIRDTWEPLRVAAVINWILGPGFGARYDRQLAEIEIDGVDLENAATHGAPQKCWWLGSGHHRACAYLLLEVPEMPCQMRPGPIRWP